MDWDKLRIFSGRSRCREFSRPCWRRRLKLSQSAISRPESARFEEQLGVMLLSTGMAPPA